MQLLIKIQDLYFTSSTLLKHKPDEHFTAIFKNVLISQGFCDTKGIIM